MAVDSATFLARFPEFTPATTAMVEAALAEAIKNVDSEVFGDKAEDATFWKAAHLLAISPFGQQARMVNKEGDTTYGVYFYKLAKSVTPGFRVA